VGGGVGGDGGDAVVALEHDTSEWAKNRNSIPRPFMWTKTAEDILQSLSKDMVKISCERYFPSSIGPFLHAAAG
jgi:hypothetical protein